MRFDFAAVLTLAFSALTLNAGETLSANPVKPDGQPQKEYREALTLYERGMYDRSMLMFRDLAEKTGNEDARGYYILNAACLQVPGYETLIEDFADRHGSSGLIPQIRYRYALNLFDLKDFSGASAQFEQLLLNIVVFAEVRILNRFNAGMAQMLYQFSTAPVLDYIAGLVAVERLPASSAGCTVRFTLVEGHGTVLIPEGTRVSSSDGVVIFRTTEDVIVESDTLTVDVQAQADTPGEVGNGRRVVVDDPDGLLKDILLRSAIRRYGLADQEIATFVDIEGFGSAQIVERLPHVLPLANGDLRILGRCRVGDRHQVAGAVLLLVGRESGVRPNFGIGRTPSGQPCGRASDCYVENPFHCSCSIL